MYDLPVRYRRRLKSEIYAESKIRERYTSGGWMNNDGFKQQKAERSRLDAELTETDTIRA